MKKNNICISHALNEGEYHVPGTRFHCNGFCASTNTVYEFLGCHWHGCPTCYPTDRYLIKILGTDKSATELHTLTRLREKAIKDRGYNYVSIWEHQFRARLECNSEMRDFVQTLDLMEPIDPRESFFGGRTNAIRLHCQIQSGQEIRVCAEKEQDTPCQHTDEERCFVGTWTTPELAKALEKEYQILKIYQVYHWPKTTQYDPTLREGGLFAKYINTFLKLKQESSGFPSWCKTMADCKKYVEQYFAHEGIQLDWDFIEKNKGLRALAKLCLNSLWGKLGQQNNMMSSRYFFKDQVDDFYQLLTDRTKVVQNLNIMNEETVHVSYVSSSEFSTVSTNTNINLATFTTAWARLKLYDVLDTLREDVLYHDTDSVIYPCRPGENKRPLGDYLGELTDELQGDFITIFVSGGPKNYAYRTSKGEEKVCVKGFSLNFTNSRLINFAIIKALLMHENLEERSEPLNKRRKIDTLNNRKIFRDKAKNVIYNRPEKKMYRVVYTKRALDLSTMKTLPY
ncbi:hypothetical protein FSP39_024929 [Pinctada imbricata]|uniref:DNA-directed DNA polymerase n=1 Tax=Pinctada imbricata TaxID=66713 RepID=A0AA89C5A2_PINIB|nr:hypothetical protein FSP39_024929 [Pinctada imbricata]